MPGFVERIQRHVGKDGLHARAFLRRLLRQLAHVALARRNGAKPFFGQRLHLCDRNVAGYAQHGVGGIIVLDEECLHVAQLRILNVLQVLADGHPVVGVHAVGQRAQVHPGIAVRLVEVVLFKFLAHHLALHIQAFLGEGKASIRSLSSQNAVSIFCTGSWM